MTAPNQSVAGTQRQAGPLRYMPWLTAVVLLLCVTPALPYLPGAGDRRLEEFVLLLLLGIVAVRYAYGSPTRAAWGIWQWLFLGYVGIVLLSILAGGIMGLDASLLDLFELVRTGKNLVIYTLVATVVHTAVDPARARERILHVIVIASLALVPIVVQQYFDLFGLNGYYVEAVAKGNQANDLLSDDYAIRAIGMVGNPNEMGFLFAVTALVTIQLLITRRRWFPWGLLVLALQMAALLMSLSRSALVAVALGAAYLVLTLPWPTAVNPFKESAYRFGRVLSLVLALALAVALLVNNRAIYDEVLWRFALLGDFTQDSSWTGRLLQWQANLELFARSPWIGVGPLFGADFRYVGDNEWLTLLRSYGLLGTSYLIVAVVGPHLASLASPAAEPLRSQRRLVEAVLLATATYMVTAAVFQSLVLMPLVLIIIASADTTSRVRVLRK